MRVAAEMLHRKWEGIEYFPSFEIITSTSSRGQYFSADCREVTEEGVLHVMRLFFKHYAQTESTRAADTIARVLPDTESEFLDRAQRVVDTICEENLIEQHVRSSQ